MPQEGTPYLIPFGAHGMVAHPNRWRAQPGELTLAQNVVLENDMLQKEPASQYYHPTGQGTGEPLELLRLDGSWGAVQTTLAFGVWLEVTVGGGFVNATFTAGSVAPGASFPIVLTGGVAVGQVHVVTLSREAGTGGVASMTDTKGNLYTELGVATGAGMQIEVWAANVTTALLVGDTLTVVPDDATADINVIGSAYSGIGFSAGSVFFSASGIDIAGTTFATATATDLAMRPHQYPVLGIGVVAGTSTVPVLTLGADWVSRGVSTVAVHRQVQASEYLTGTGSIIAQIEFNSGVTGPLTGLVQTFKDTPQVNGAGTLFLTELRPGDEIIVVGEAQVVSVISSDTLLATVDTWDTNNAGVAATRRAGPVVVTALTQTFSGTSTLLLLKERPLDGLLGNKGDLGFDLLATLAQGVPRSARFVVGGKELAANARKLFFLDGLHQVQVMATDPAGNTGVFATIGNPAADWGVATDSNTQPINAIVHADSLMAFGNLNDAHRLYISSPTDHENFTAAGGAITLRIASQIGQRLFGAAQYQGVLFLWKHPTGIFYLDDTPIDRFQWGYRIRSAALGCAPSPHAVLSTDDDVIFCDADGHFHLLSAVDTLGGTRDSDLTRAFGLQKWTQNNVHIPSLTQLVSVYDPSTKTAWFGVRSLDAYADQLPFNDLIIRFDFSRRAEQEPTRVTTGMGSIRVTTSRVWRPGSLTTKRRDFTGRRAILIGQIGQAWLTIPDFYGFKTDRNGIALVDVANGIATETRCAAMDMADAGAGLRHIRKRFGACEVVLNEVTNLPLLLEFWVDGVLKQSLNYQQAGVRRIMKTLNCGDGYDLEVRLITDTSTIEEPAPITDVPVLGVAIYYTPTSTDHSRRS